MEPYQILEYASISVSLFFFALGSFFDLKTREVSDKAWLAYGPIGLLLTINRLFLEPSLIILTIASIALTTLVSFALFYFGLFGGADAKAIMCLGITIPLIPNSYQPLIGYVHPFFPIVVVVVGFICSISVAVWLGLRNLLAMLSQRSQMFEGLRQEPSWKKVMASVTGYLAAVSKLASTFYLYPMEEVVEDSSGAHRRFHLFFSAEIDRDQMVSKFIESLGKVGSPGMVWVSPGLPMLLFIFIGLIITLALGDPIFSAVFLLATR